MKHSEHCPCGSEISFSRCCKKYMDGDAKAETAAQLMRSRYSAYVIQNETYLKKTWHESTRPVRIEFSDQIKWLRVNIKNTEQGEIKDEHGIVEFIATYKNSGRAHQLHEVSRFVRDHGNWFYLDGSCPDKAPPE